MAWSRMGPAGRRCLRTGQGPEVVQADCSTDESRTTAGGECSSPCGARTQTDHTGATARGERSPARRAGRQTGHQRAWPRDQRARPRDQRARPSGRRARPSGRRAVTGRAAHSSHSQKQCFPHAPVAQRYTPTGLCSSAASTLGIGREDRATDGTDRGSGTRRLEGWRSGSIQVADRLSGEYSAGSHLDPQATR